MEGKTMGAISGFSGRGIARESIGWSIAFSVLLILLGLFALASPLIAGVAVEAIVAWLLIFAGVGHLVLAWHVRGAGAHIWEALIGLAYIVAGIYLLMHPLAGLVGLTAFLGAYLIVKAIFEAILAMRVRPLPGSGWMFLDALMSLVLAALILWHWPSATEWAVGTLVGVAILFSGISRLAFSMAARRVAAAIP
jgi:uncharacterized membrane protein HdeD (DUF308 family)